MLSLIQFSSESDWSVIAPTHALLPVEHTEDSMGYEIEVRGLMFQTETLPNDHDRLDRYPAMSLAFLWTVPRSKGDRAL
jgi:hypothetical protein